MSIPEKRIVIITKKKGYEDIPPPVRKPLESPAKESAKKKR